MSALGQKQHTATEERAAALEVLRLFYFPTYLPDGMVSSFPKLAPGVEALPQLTKAAEAYALASSPRPARVAGTCFEALLVTPIVSSFPKLAPGVEALPQPTTAVC